MKRIIIQILSFFGINPHVVNFINGTIYQGKTKNFCVPVLNCWSCPGASHSCPIGAIQFYIGHTARYIAFYTLGILFLTVSLTGRFVCGYVCPFGFFQDLLHKIPTGKRIRVKPGFRYLKYAVLVIFVILLPLLTANNDPWFSKVCPAGFFFAAFPLLLADKTFIQGISYFFYIKAGIAIIIAGMATRISRPFCQTMCPLGAIFELCRPFYFSGIDVDMNKCISCNKCYSACPMDIKVYQKKNDCIQCGECVKICPVNAISINYFKFRTPQLKKTERT